MPHTRPYVRSILNSAAAAGGFPDLAPWHTHTRTHRYPSLSHWTFTHGLVVEYPWKRVQCSKSLLPVLLEKGVTKSPCAPRIPIPSQTTSQPALTQWPTYHTNLSTSHKGSRLELPRDHPYLHHHWPIVAETATPASPHFKSSINVWKRAAAIWQPFILQN